MEHELFVILSVISPIVAAIIAYATIRYSKKTHERTAMMDVFHMFNDEHKDTEDKIIEYFKKGILNKFYQSPPFQNSVKKVWRHYDQIGLLANKDLIPKDEFFSLLGLKMVSVYYCSRSEIEKRRVTRPLSLMFFTNIVIDCWEYWNKKEISIFNPVTNDAIKLSDLGEKVQP